MRISIPLCRFEQEILPFIKGPFTKGDIIFAGGTIIYDWKLAGTEFAPLTVQNYGLNGADSMDALTCIQDLSLKKRPIIILYYYGDSDASTATPHLTLRRQTAYFHEIQSRSPTSTLVFMSILRSPKANTIRSFVDTVNEGLFKICAQNSPYTFFFDANAQLERSTWDPKSDMYRSDGVHLTQKGYSLLKESLLPLLRALWIMPTCAYKNPTVAFSKPLFPQGEIIFAGSSIIAYWKTAETAFSPLPVHNHGIPGATTVDALACIMNVAIRYYPSMLLAYYGSNDVFLPTLNSTLTVQRQTQYFLELNATVPGITVVFMSVLRAPQKNTTSFRSFVENVNAGLRELCATNSQQAFFFDANPALEITPWQPKAGMYRSDRLHLTSNAYGSIEESLQPFLQNLWNNKRTGRNIAD